jgi:hypothetical protein
MLKYLLETSSNQSVAFWNCCLVTAAVFRILLTRARVCLKFDIWILYKKNVFVARVYSHLLQHCVYGKLGSLYDGYSRNALSER